VELLIIGIGGNFVGAYEIEVAKRAAAHHRPDPAIALITLIPAVAKIAFEQFPDTFTEGHVGQSAPDREKERARPPGDRGGRIHRSGPPRGIGCGFDKSRFYLGSFPKHGARHSATLNCPQGATQQQTHQIRLSARACLAADTFHVLSSRVRGDSGQIAMGRQYSFQLRLLASLAYRSRQFYLILIDLEEEFCVRPQYIEFSI
jgi:hypothetical protein